MQLRREVLKKNKRFSPTRRQTIVSIAALGTATVINPSTIFSVTPAKASVKFAVIGDWGIGDKNQFDTAKQLLATYRQTPFDFVLTVGDNIYPDGNARLLASRFEQPYAGLLQAGVPFYAILGNHDVINGRREQTQYPLFNMQGQNYYSLKRGKGLVEIFALDSTDFNNTQAGWLENGLKTSNAKWKICAFHHPIYSSARTHGSDFKLRKKLEPLFIRYGVNMVLSGHDHTYERTHPQQNINYFVTGAAGQIRYGDVILNSELRAASFDRDNHFMLIETKHAEINFQAISRIGTVVDSGSLK
jgi:3',5'-cyclic AMP phosphodiesterase CpdA